MQIAISPNVGTDRCVYSNAARVHLLWTLLEHELRREITYSLETARWWASTIEWYSLAVDPLRNVCHSAFMVALPEGGSTVNLIKYAAERMRAATTAIQQESTTPVESIFTALDHIRQARKALQLMPTCAALNSDPVIDRNPATNETLLSVLDMVNSHLQILTTRQAGRTLDQQRDQSRYAYLTIYFAAAFNSLTFAPYQATIQYHLELMHAAPPHPLGMVLQQRLNTLNTITPTTFGPTAIRLLDQKKNHDTYTHTHKGYS